MLKEITTRKIAAGLFISLDGVIEAPETWHFPYFDDEMGAAATEALGSMRKFVVSEFVSLDGVMEDPGRAEGFEHGGWTMPYWDIAALSAPRPAYQGEPGNLRPEHVVGMFSLLGGSGDYLASLPRSQRDAPPALRMLGWSSALSG